MLELEKQTKEKRFNPAYIALEKSMFSALETYSNIHRGTGHFSMVSTNLFELAREIVLEYLKLNKKKYVVIFCTPRRLMYYKAHLKKGSYLVVSSKDFGLPLGVRGIAIERKILKNFKVFETGGGIVKYVSPKSVIWADIPDRFEAGTPNIINVIAFARALKLIEIYGPNIFKTVPIRELNIQNVLYQDNLLDYSGKEMILKLRDLLIGKDILVPTAERKTYYTNLDNAASTPTFLPIWEVIPKLWGLSKEDKQEIIDEVQNICAEFLGATANYELIFTGNTTEAINIIVNNLFNNFKKNFKPVIINFLLDHHSNELVWRYIPGTSLIRLGIDDKGFFELTKLEQLLEEYNVKKMHGKKRVCLVSVCGASNVLGTMNDISKISKVIHKYGAQLLVDGAQLVAHRSVNLIKDGIDYFAFSAHKAYAPFGSGALLVKKELIKINSDKLRKLKSSGEENIIGIATMGKALLLLKRIGLSVIEEEERKLTRLLLDNLNTIEDIEIYGIKDSKSTQLHDKGGVVVFNLKRVPYNIVAREFAEYGGIGVRDGCFCAHLLVKNLIGIHPVRQFGAMLFMRFTPTLGGVYLPGLVRVSLGLENDDKDILHFIEILEGINTRKRALINKLLASTHSGTGFRPHPLIPKPIKSFINTRIEKVYFN